MLATFYDMPQLVHLLTKSPSERVRLQHSCADLENLYAIWIVEVELKAA